jgi:hypothetical protein
MILRAIAQAKNVAMEKVDIAIAGTRTRILSRTVLILTSDRESSVANS